MEAAIRAVEELLWLVWEPEERREVGVARVAGAVAVAPLLARATHTELQLTSGAASMFAEGFSVSDVVRMIEYCACQVQLGGWELRTVPGGGKGARGGVSFSACATMPSSRGSRSSGWWHSS